MKPHIWLIEIFENGKWQPTVGAYLTRMDARAQKLYEWEFNNQSDQFRIRKYERVE